MWKVSEEVVVDPHVDWMRDCLDLGGGSGGGEEVFRGDKGIISYSHLKQLVRA